MHNTFHAVLIKLPLLVSVLLILMTFCALLLTIQHQEREEDLLRIDDIAEIDASTSSEINSKFTMYLREGDSEKRREQFYCKELGKKNRFCLTSHIATCSYLGFAMEKLRDGYTISDLWNVISLS
jgi:hypothetical protein